MRAPTPLEMVDEVIEVLASWSFECEPMKPKDAQITALINRAAECRKTAGHSRMMPPFRPHPSFLWPGLKASWLKASKRRMYWPHSAHQRRMLRRGY